MNSRYKRKVPKIPFLKILMVPVLILLSFTAIRAGIAVGNMLYGMNMKVLENVDTENFKSTLNNSFPIIDTIYNSGKMSVSFSGEIKSMLNTIFEFDLDSPLTILNVQSPLMFSYYNNEYKSHLAKSEQPPKPGTINTPDAKTPDSGNQPGNITPSPATGTDKGNGQENQGPDSTVTKPPEFASSTFFEEEDEEQQEKSDIVSHDKIVVQNYTSFKIDIEQLLKEPLKINFAKKGPKVLIYHTHTTEGYVVKPQDIGKKGIPSYTNDPRYNVVRVGEELSKNLKKYNIDVLHNGTIHDADRDAAYGVSIKTLEKYKKSYPSVKVFLDLHRDGLDASQPKMRVIKNINGKNAAQVMFVVGTNGMLPHPNWKENLKFALKLQQKLNEKAPGLARPVWISKKRYNENISNEALIIEIGGDGNLLSECLESTKYLAQALNEVMQGK